VITEVTTYVVHFKFHCSGAVPIHEGEPESDYRDRCDEHIASMIEERVAKAMKSHDYELYGSEGAHPAEFRMEIKSWTKARALHAGLDALIRKNGGRVL
jgi:hypothetical protein